MKISIITFNERNGKILEEEFRTLGIEADTYSGSELVLEVGSEMDVKHEERSLLEAPLLLLPDYGRIEFFYQLACIAEKKVPTLPSAEILYLLMHRALMQKFLRDHRIPVREIHLFSREHAGRAVLKTVKMPVILTLPSGRRVLVKNIETFTDLIGSLDKSAVVAVEKPLKPKFLIHALVTEEEMVSVKKSGEKLNTISVPEDVRRISRKIMELLSVPFCYITFIPYKNSFLVNEVELSCDFALLQKITGKNVARMIAESVRLKIKEAEAKRVERFFRIFSAVERWWNETRDTRP